MYHECPFNLIDRANATPVNRFIRVTEVLDEPANTEYAPLDRYMYALPLHPMTDEENRFLKDVQDGDAYCVTAAAVVFCRILGTKPNKQKMQPSHFHYWDIASHFQKIIGTDAYLRHGSIMYLVAYIHNHLHNGPVVALPIPPSNVS